MSVNFRIGAMLFPLVTFVATNNCCLGQAASEKKVNQSSEGKKVIYRDSEIEVIQGRTEVIIPEHKVYCGAANIFVYNNGEIQVSNLMQTSNQKGRPIEPKAMRSRDGGKTWMEAPVNHFIVGSYQFAEPDGEVIAFPWQDCFRTLLRHDGNVHKIPFYRSKDNGLTEITDTAILHCPDFQEIYWGQAIMRLRDGSLLACFSSKFKNDKKSRAIVVRSTDRGKSWHYLSTVAFDLRKSKRNEGFNEPVLDDEPVLVVSPNGDILCFMRSESGAGSNPLYMARSNNNGKTWSHADPIADHGVWPNACLMKNGVIALIFGRPGNTVMFSYDEGETWVGKKVIYSGPVCIDCGNYSSIAEIAPGKLLAVYHRTNPEDYLRNEIVGAYLTVKRAYE